MNEWLAWLAALIAPQEMAIDLEPPRAAAAVSFAAASMARDESPPPAPPPAPPEPDNKCCSECRGTGWVVQPDGHRTPCACPEACECKSRSRSSDCRRCLGLGVVAVWTADDRWLEPCKCCNQ